MKFYATVLLEIEAEDVDEATFLVDEIAAQARVEAGVDDAWQDGVPEQAL